MLLIDAETVHRLCGWPALVASLRAAHDGPRVLIARASIEAEQRGITQTYFNLPAFLPGVAMGTKIATILPDNPTRHPGVPARARDGDRRKALRREGGPAVDSDNGP